MHASFSQKVGQSMGDPMVHQSQKVLTASYDVLILARRIMETSDFSRQWGPAYN